MSDQIDKDYEALEAEVKRLGAENKELALEILRLKAELDYTVEGD